MVKVECDGCKSTYEVEDRRIPAAGLKMRCAKCGKSLLVTKDGPARPTGASASALPKAVPGPIDFDIDLPAIVPKEPARFEPAAAPKRPAIEMESFGDLDSIVDLPASPARAGADRGQADLPAVAKGPRPAAEQKRPLKEHVARPSSPARPAVSPAAMGDIDLPTPVATDAQLEALKKLRAASRSDLPAVASGADLPAPVTADLPAPVAADLPAPVAADLPAPVAPDLPVRKDTTNRGGARPVRKETFGELDLALTLGPESDIKDAALIEAEIQAQMSAQKRSGAATDPSGASRAPVAARPVTSPKGAPPIAALAPKRASSDEPAGAFDFSLETDVPARAESAGLPSAARAEPPAPNDEAPNTDPEPDGFDFPLEEGNLPLPEPAAPGLDLGLDTSESGSVGGQAAGLFGGGSGGSLTFDIDGPPPVASPEVKDSSASAGAPPGGGLFGGPAGGGAGALGGGMSMAVDSPQDLAREASAKAKPSTSKEPEAKPPSKRSTLKRAALASVVIVGGAALTLLPDIGPFGWNYVSDRINATAHASAFAEMKSRAQEELDGDSMTTTASAFAEARAAHARMPRHRGAAAYAAFVAYTRTVRFGRKGGEDAIGKQLLIFAQSAPNESLDLAIAAQALADGKLDRARSSINYMLRRAPSDVDAAVISGEVELAAGDKTKAVEAWKHAVSIRKSARTLYGEARALLLAGDVDGAIASARGALAASPKHVGASTLLASLIWQRAGGDDEAVSLLKKVTAPGEVRDSASERELIEAGSLLGEIHLARSRITAADEAFNAALKLDPQAMRALLGSGELYYRSGRFAEAAARFEAATRAEATNVDAQLGTAKTLLAQERAKEAKDVLKKARGANPKNAKIAYWQGRVEEALGNKKEAEAAYLEVIAMGGAGPEVIDAYVALTYLLSSLGRQADAAAKLAEATEKFPDRPALHKAKGDVALQTGRYEEAKSEYEIALAKEDDLGTRFKLAQALRRGRLYEEAAAQLNKIEAADKEFPSLALERGLLFEETGDRDKALQMYAAALQKSPNDVDLKLRVGSAQVMAGQVQQAETILRDVLKARPQSAEANHFLGRAILLRGVNLSESIRFLDRAVELDPNRAEYFVYVAWAANETNQATRAEAAITRAIALDQENGDAYWQRGILLQKQGSSVDALKDLQTALAKRPSRFEAYATMALCYQDLNRWPEAEAAFQKAIAGSDTVPEWHYRLGKIHLARGNRPLAQAEIEKALALVEASTKPPPTSWIFDAHFIEAEFLRGAGQNEKAIEHYKAFLATAPAVNAYRADAEKALKALGAIR